MLLYIYRSSVIYYILFFNIRTAIVYAHTPVIINLFFLNIFVIIKADVLLYIYIYSVLLVSV